MRPPPRITRPVATGKRKPNQRRAVAHLSFVREIGICLACGAERHCQAMHIRNRTDGGVGLRPSDRFSVPGCSECHARQHRDGEITFWGRVGIDPINVACRLWTVSGDVEQGRRAVRRARQRADLRGGADMLGGTMVVLGAAIVVMAWGIAL